MARPVLEVADIFRDHGPAWRKANAGHVSLGQLKVMSAIESCRTAALGGHVMRCEDCSHTAIAYNSCRNRHCPKCQGSQALAWMEERKAELLAVPYFHVVFTLPARIAAIGYQNKAVIYDLLFKASSQTMLTIAADPKRLGVKIGFTSVLHTWGSAMTHHPHVHMIVPGGGISLDGTRWIGCRPKYLLPVKVLSRLFRRLKLEMLLAAHDAGRLQFFGDHAHLADKTAFKAYLAPLHRTKWFVYSKWPFAGPEQVLAYLSRYTHRVAISNSRLIAADATGVTFRYKDYRIKGPGRYKTMTLKPDEFIRRFLMHVLPNGFHRIRHYGLLASGTKAATIVRARELIAAAAPAQTAHQPQPPDSAAATDKPPVPVLRRSHEHHRDLQARRDAAIPTAAANRDQDRYIMITFSTSQIQNVDLSHGSSIRHDDARANARLRSQLVHRSSLLKADTYARSAPFMRGNVVDQRTHGCRLPSASSSAARKSP